MTKEKIKTGIYLTKVIRCKKELTFGKCQLEKKIEEYRTVIDKRKRGGGKLLIRHPYRLRLNIKRLENLIKTAQILIDGYGVNQIKSELNIKDSTLINYMKYMKL